MDEYEIRFYDLVGYLVPGAMTLLAGWWFLVSFCAIQYRIDISSVTAAIVFVALSYWIGNLMQALGNLLEPIYEKRWGGKFEDQFLDDSNDYYTRDFRQLLKERIEATFNISLASPATATDPNVQTRRRQEAFHLCHALIAQFRAAQRPAIFQGLFALYRGTLASALIIWFVAIAIAIKEAALLVSALNYLSIPSGTFFIYDPLQLASASILMPVLFIATLLIGRRMRRFSQHYVNAVYQGFYAWSILRVPVTSPISAPEDELLEQAHHAPTR